MDQIECSGFQKDVVELLDKLQSQNNYTFQAFCEAWKDMHFQFVFSGFRNDTQLVNNVNNYLLLVKDIFLAANTLEERIILFYLLYAIYFKQPPLDYCKIRVIAPQWVQFINFYRDLGTHESFNAQRYMFWKMIASGAFLLVEHVKEYTFEHFLKKDMDEELAFESKVKAFKGVFEQKQEALLNAESGLIPALEMLQDGYNEMKDILDSNSKAKTLTQTSILSNIKDGLKNLSNIFELIPENSDDSASGDDVESQNTIPKKSRSTTKQSISDSRKNIKAKAMGANLNITKNTKHLVSKEIAPLGDEMKESENSTNDISQTPQNQIKIEFDENRDSLKLRMPKKNYAKKMQPKHSKSWHVVTTVTTDNGPETDEFMITECDEIDNQCSEYDDRSNESAGLSFNIDIN